MSLKSRAAALLGLASLALLALAPTALADSGGLDAGYGTGGKTQLPASLGTTTVEDSVRLADGGIAITGRIGAPGSRDVYVAKFAAGGALDASFDGDGVAIIDAGGDDIAYGLSVRSNGGFVIAGADGNDPDNDTGFVAKVLANGAADAAWDPSGVVFATGALTQIYIAHELSSGEVLYAGIEPGYRMYYGCMANDGLPFSGTCQANASFSPSSATFTAGAATVTSVLSFDKRSDGRWQLVGTRSDGTDTAGEIVYIVFDEPAPGSSAPITPDTENDIPFAAGNVFAASQLRTGDTTLLTGATDSAATDRGALWQLTSSGAFDAGFGTNGLLRLPTAASGWISTGAAQDSTGKWYVIGDLGTDQIRTLRLNSDLSLDTTFAKSGIADRSYGSSPNRAGQIFIDASNRPLATGTLGTAAAAWRVERFDYAAFTLGPVTYSPSFVQRLNTVNFSYSVKNTGPDASDVTVDLDIPASFESQSFATSFGAATPVADKSGATWTIPQLAAGATATLTLSGKPGDVGVLSTTASITGQSAERIGAAPASASTSVMVYGAATPRDDVITGTPRKDVIDALAGNDIVYALAGDDIISGNLGNDRLYGQAGNDTLSGDEGNDLVDGGAGNDTASGGAGNDRVLGGAGNDKLDGGSGNDVVDGGSGNDKVAGGAGNDLLYGRDGNDRLNSGDGNDKVFAGKGNDTVFGGAGADKLYGEGGNDYLIAQGSGDQLFGGPGRDRLDGGADADKIWGGTGDDWINGKTGNDYLNGNEGNDWIRGFEGNDTLIGGGGDDLLNGGSGKDTFSAGSGDDIVRADDGFGGDVIDCGAGWDLVYANPGDTVADNCEYVKYDVPAGTRFSGDRGGNAPVLWAQRVRRG